MTQQTDRFTITTIFGNLDVKAGFIVNTTNSMSVNNIKLVVARQVVQGADLVYPSDDDFIQNRQQIVGCLRSLQAWYKEKGHDYFTQDTTGNGVWIAADVSKSGARELLENPTAAATGDSDAPRVFFGIGNSFNGGDDATDLAPDTTSLFVTNTMDMMIDYFLEITTGN